METKHRLAMSEVGRRVADKSRSIPLHLVYALSSRVNNVLQLQIPRSRSKASGRGRCYPSLQMSMPWRCSPPFRGKYISSNASRIQLQNHCPASLYASLLFLSKRKRWLIIPPRRRCHWLLRCTLSTTIAHSLPASSKSIEPLVDPQGKWGVFLPNEQQPTVWHR